MFSHLKLEKFCYLRDALGAREGGFDSVIIMIRSGLCKRFSAFLAGRSSSLQAKGRLYSAYVRSAMLYESATWPVNKKDVIRLGINNARMVRWICKVRPEDSIFAEELRTRLNLKSMK